MMNDAISLGRSLLKTSLGVAGTIFTGIGKVMSTAANIVGEENGKSAGNTTTNIQSTVNILVLQKNAKAGKNYNEKNRRNQKKRCNGRINHATTVIDANTKNGIDACSSIKNPSYSFNNFVVFVKR